ncbi:MAG: hypothetical protein AB1445_07450 [Bacillota bacterium]
MIVQRFRGKSLPEVTREVRRTLGPEAIILEIRSPARMWRWLGRGKYEVLAALEEALLAHAPGPAPRCVATRPDVPARFRHHAAGAAKSRVVRAVAALCGDGYPLTLEAGRTSVCALVGPTGVGKTTTVAKLAARFALKEGRRVALVTTDTYRVGAIEQLRVYADIMGVPVEVVERPVALKRAVDRYAGYDLVLIDTAGRNQLRQQLDETGAGLSLVRPDFTMLLLSVSTRSEELQALLSAYRPLGYNRLVAAKVDEALDASGLLDLATMEGAPLSYLTTGQLVPDDLEVATADHILAALMGRWRP